MNYSDRYSSVKIIEDPTNGLVKFGLIDRVGSERKTKITNNFVSQVEVLDAKVLKTIIGLLNGKLPTGEGKEKILGMQSSGVPMATALALERSSKFVFSTSTNFGLRQDVFSFSEGHREDKKHYIYGLEKGDSVIIVEDEVTSGYGIALLVKALMDYGMKVIAVCTAIETLTFGARKLVKDETGIDLISLIKIEVD